MESYVPFIYLLTIQNRASSEMEKLDYNNYLNQSYYKGHFLCIFLWSFQGVSDGFETWPSTALLNKPE